MKIVNWSMMSRHFPPLPIEINYEYHHYGARTDEDMDCMLSALKLPDRIRWISLKMLTHDLDTFFEGSKCPFPALESLAIRDQSHNILKIPAILKRSSLHLRYLKLPSISFPSISGLLSSTPVLTDLSLGIHENDSPLPVSSLLLTHLQGMPCLRCLELEVSLYVDNPVEPTEPKETFSLSKLTSLRYDGPDVYLNSLVAGFAAPNLRDVEIDFQNEISSSVVRLSRFIEDIGERYQAVRVVFQRFNFCLSFFTDSENICGLHSPRFGVCLKSFLDSIAQISSAFSALLSTIRELFLISPAPETPQDVTLWHGFLLRFDRVKTLRMNGIDSRLIARALHQGHGGSGPAFLPALEEIELCTYSFQTLQNQPAIGAAEMEAFQPFISARQQTGHPVKVFWGPSLL